jgi:cation diffusion facilitator CzcD-associated flavoprotein CzcO
MLKNIEIGVIGAGPSGITTVGSLLERGYTNITWIDPYF